jgi:hypothetical protein
MSHIATESTTMSKTADPINAAISIRLIMAG